MNIIQIKLGSVTLLMSPIYHHHTFHWCHFLFILMFWCCVQCCRPWGSYFLHVSDCVFTHHWKSNFIVPSDLELDAFAQSQKATGLVGQDLPLVKLYWPSWITSLSCISLNIISWRTCSTNFPGTEVRLINLYFPNSSFFPFLKFGVMFSFLQSLGTSYDGHDSSDMMQPYHSFPSGPWSAWRPAQ